MLKRNLFNISLVAVLILALSACGDKTSPGWEYMPDMYRGPALSTYQAYDQFQDSLSARKPVAGTIPRGFMSYQKFENTAEGYEKAKAEMKMPADFPTDSITLMDGGKLYGIYCGHCHGEKGNGMGILVTNEKYVGVPSYDTREINLGSTFHVITYGKGVMGAHASQVTPEERWKVAQYVMKLRGELINGETPKKAESKGDASADSTATGEQGAEGDMKAGQEESKTETKKG